MKIKITNFKAITTTQEFDLENINVIAGQNSGGKSSLIHALLFLKQNIDDRHEQESLKFNKPLLSLGRFEDITSKNHNNGNMTFSFILSYDDLSLCDVYSLHFRRKFKDISKVIYTIEFESKRQSIGNRVYIKFINIDIYDLSNNMESITFTRTRSDNFDVIMSDSFSYLKTYFDEILPNDLFFKTKISVGDILLDRLYLKNDNHRRVTVPIIDYISRVIFKKFQSIYYIGPLRESPKNYYYFEDSGSSLVGTKGEFTPQFLAKNKNRDVEYYQFDNELKIQSTIFGSTKYWICDFFELASDMNLDKDNNGVLYQINLTLPNSSTKVSINNVGFGISQILPIIVQSMALPKNSILILEQPEIHLHPTVQAKLFDFLNLLYKRGVSTIVETHSDHLITRMRRRVAESNDGLEQRINLIFVEYSNENQSTKYSRMSLDELGNFNLWPEGFFDQYDIDVRAILKAQIMKKKKARSIRKEEC
ncbi:DUF3696 domain-containing protein [Photobacterium phosphoreum]|uniref:DUF3696 domain-containing protein n=1 Tax=Photobacterium phosphoreum TaxID=659 RepID=UPI001E2B9CA7|nr:DUF3696 domain-containing protein [Photobacterium phosphoreum]MCD9501290.1 DUF3696 domain-containing protein [Photobacterium phosphoreum]